MATDRKAAGRQEMWQLVLYISSDSQLARKTESRLRAICDQHLPDRYHLEVLDIKKDIEKVPADVLAVPMVARLSPRPERRVIGNLSQSQKVIEGLGLDEA